MSNNPSNTEKMAEAGFAELERRGFRVGASDLGTEDLLAVFKAMQAEQHQGEPVAPYFYYAECNDPDYSGLYNHKEEAQTQVADHGGAITGLWNIPPTGGAPDEVERLRKEVELLKINVGALEFARDSCKINETAIKAAGHETIDDLAQERDALRGKLSEEKRGHLNTIDQRDLAEDMANKLAVAVRDHFRVDVGEHSNMHCPWTTALEILDGDFKTDSDQDREVERLLGDLTLTQLARQGDKIEVDGLKALNDGLRVKLAGLVSAVRSINHGRKDEVRMPGDDEPCYAQRKEWIDWVLGLCDAALSASVEPASFAQVAVVPDGYCLMPTSLTAENGAKGLLSGEFNVSREHDCHECAETDDDDCEVCGGHGSYTQETPVGWDTIKDIYRKAVDGLSLKGQGQAPAAEGESQ
ncbi:hypothetical protein [Pseudomonas sp. MWU12-2323]|uniref:hypothetical protein n=1 Tax=Pseudomonas sp. MWU12-2323 TaxID=2651296 RepID=UPI00128BA06C|nr:hypothetical protein [Pseudomonas sp. MWU12-2323]MPQ71458.1 hypothetical protein [Pseudomonas sp. MWU12-2323]